MRIAILTPYLQQVEALFAKSLADLMYVSARQHPDWNIQFAMQQGSCLPQSRTMLLVNALRAGADWVLWLDSDMTFPPDTLARLLAAGKPVVGVNYARRSTPTSWTAWRGGEVATTRPGFEQVDHIGFGAALVSGEVLRALKPPYFGIESDGLNFVTEDVFFFRKVREAGFAVYVDHGLSLEIGHMHKHLLTHEDVRGATDAIRTARPAAGVG